MTISAPEASTARRFSSKSRYLPVPTISRELNRRPATVRPSWSSTALQTELADARDHHNTLNAEIDHLNTIIRDLKDQAS